MATTETRWCKIGDYIRIVDERNVLGEDINVLGINAQKEFMPTVANLENVDLKNYKVVRKGMFVFSGMQTGRDECIRIAMYSEDSPCVISPAYITFEITKKDELFPTYLFMYFMRSEMDRYGWFISDSSVRSNLDLPRFVNISIPIPFIDGRPDIARQKEIAESWQGLREMKEQNEETADTLFQLCRSYMEKVKKEYESVEIGPYIEEVDERNEDFGLAEDKVVGLSTSKEIIKTKANLDGVNVDNYKIFHPHSIAYVADTSRRGDKVSLAMNDTDEKLLVSSISIVFKTKNEEQINSEYLLLWFKRPEFDRYARFHSIGSAREAFSFERMQHVAIPLPPIEKQLAIVEIYHCAEEAKCIAAEADKQSREICPALMQYVIHENN